MAQQMWFGNEQRFQWVPAPATGMEVANVGFSEQIDYQTGRKGIVRSMQTHKEYSLDFPVQEASGLQGLDVFNKFAMGFYGDLDGNPLFFADPMNYDQNLMPAGWASPGLYTRGWAPIVEDTGRSYYNYAINPSVEVNSTGYTTTAGTSGTASGARTSSGTQVSGAWSYRATWTVATSAVSGGVNYTATPALEGTTYDVSAYVTANKIQRVLMTVRFRNSGGTSIGTFAGTQTVLAANTPAKLQVPSALAPVGTATMDIEVAAVAGTSGANWAISDWLQIDAVMINLSSAIPTAYFDGSVPGAAWTGTANASASYMYVPRITPTISDTPANSYNLPPKQATWNVTVAANAAPSGISDMPYALIPIPPGYNLWLGASGSATGTAVVGVQLFTTPANLLSTTSLTLLSSAGATRLNASYSGNTYQYAKVYITRTSTVVSTITLSGLMAQLWPIGVTPVLTGNFIEGKGHRGLKFADDAAVESYVLVDPTRNVPVHYKGLSARLIEAQDRG